MSEDLTLEVSQKMCLYSQTKGAVQEVVANGAVVGGLVVVADLQVVAWGKRVFSRPLLRRPLLLLLFPPPLPNLDLNSWHFRLAATNFAVRAVA